MAKKNLVTKRFACGPGKVRIDHINDCEDWREEETYYDSNFADRIEDLVFEDDLSDLAQYYHGRDEFGNNPISSIKFTGMKSIQNNFYMIWEVTYDPEGVSEERIKDYLTGQMSDGWGEGFEQYPFMEDTTYEEVTYEDEDEDGSTRTYHDMAKTKIEYYYSPWCYGTFEVLS
jgi:hypothetical protein